LQPWMWVLIAAGLVAAVATSFLAPVSWAQYWHYVLARFGFPLLAAILTAVGLLVISLLAAGRRQTSGFVALGMFISIVAHMLTASLFGLFVLSTPVPEVDMTAGRLELSSSVPPMTESQLSQDMRAQFTATTKPDLRELSVKKESLVDPIEARAAQLMLELKHGPPPEPMQEKMKPVEASRAKAQLQEALTRTEETIPDINKTKLVALAQIKNAGETAPVKPSPRELPGQMPQKLQIDTLAAPINDHRNVTRNEMQRTLTRDTVKIEPIQHGGRKTDDILRTSGSAGKIEALNLKAKQIQDAEAPGRMEIKRTGEPSHAMDVAHQGTSAPDAPAAAMLSRELKGTMARVAAASLSDATPITRKSQPRVDTTPQQRETSHAQFLSAPVRMTDTQRPVVGPAAAALAAEPVFDTQKEVRTLRSGQTSAMQEAPLNRSKASITLERRPAAENTKFRVTSTKETAPAGADRLALQDRLLVTMGETGTHPLVDVGGSAAGIQVERTQSSMPAQLNGRDAFESIAAVKSGLTTGDIPDVNSGWVARHSVDLTTSENHTAGAGERTPFDVPGAQAQTTTRPAGDTSELTSAVSRSMAIAMVDMGGAAAPAATISSGSASEEVRSLRGIDKLRYALTTGKSQAAGSWGQPDDAAFSQRLNAGRVLSGAAGTHNSLAGKATEVLIGGLSGSMAADVDATKIENPGSAAGAGAKVADILAGLAPAMATADTGTLSSGNEIQSALARIGLKPEKADAGISQTGEQGSRSQLSLPTSSMGGNINVSLADVDALPAAQPRGTKGSGIGQDSVSLIRSGSAVGNDVRLSFGETGRELAAEGMGQGDSATVSTGPKTAAEIIVTKAGGQFMPDSAPAGGGLMDFDSASMSSSAGRPHTRMDIDLKAGGDGQRGHSAQPVLGFSGKETPRLLISDELASVPKTVPEKALYKLRTPEKRKDIIRELGGSVRTEQAVEEALIWLAKAQSDDGRWDVDGFKTISRCGGGGDRSDDDVALTGLCLLSYLGAGYTHVKGEHKESVRKALNWLVDGQKEDGNLQREGQMYGQAMATAALCESYSMTGDQRLNEPIKKAVDFILKAQNPGAGWRYEPRKDSDTSVTGWQVLALKSAMIAGFKIPPQHFQWVEKWLDCVRRGNEEGLYAYMPGHAGTPTMTAEGWFCQLMMKENTRMRGQGETIPYLMARLPVWSPKDHTVNLYFWYYTTLALHMSGAPEFVTWNKALVQALLTGQVMKGAAKGSWDPVCVLGERGGRVYTTATAALCLEVYYRYLPFYKQ